MQTRRSPQQLWSMLFVVGWSLATAPEASAQISLVDGTWSTSFDGCATAALGPGDICDGLMAVDAVYTCGPSAVPSQITAAANYPGGAGGNGLAVFFESDIVNAMSSGGLLVLADPQPELWLRFHRAWPAGQTWGGNFAHKIIYAFTDVPLIAANVNFPGGEDTIGLEPRNTHQELWFDGNGWTTLNGGLVGDGSWHAFEFHFDLGQSGSNDGLFEMWIDGVNVVAVYDIDWYAQGSQSPAGWLEVTIPSNHNVSTLPGCGESRVDDIQVAVPGYAGFVQDAQGRPMIGPYGVGGGGSGGSGGSGAAGGSGGAATGGSGSLGGGGGGNAVNGTDEDDGGCGCRVFVGAPVGGPGVGGLLGLALWALVARGPRRRPDAKRRPPPVA